MVQVMLCQRGEPNTSSFSKTVCYEQQPVYSVSNSLLVSTALFCCLTRRCEQLQDKLFKTKILQNVLEQAQRKDLAAKFQRMHWGCLK